MQQLGKLHSASKYRDKVLLESAIRQNNEIKCEGPKI